MSRVISVTASHGSHDLYFSYNDVLNADRGVLSGKRPRASVLVLRPFYISATCKVHNWHGTLALP